MTEPRPQRFSRSMRLGGVTSFAAVFENGISRSRGPLKLFALPNKLPSARLGLSVPRRVGTAPRRNLIKRKLRETFRQLDPALRARYDFVIVVRPHEPMSLTEYDAILTHLIARLAELWAARGE